jgi:hypothetical protein
LNVTLLPPAAPHCPPLPPQVASYTKADSMWYFPLLRPYYHRSATPDPTGDHIPVAADLSDLQEVIQWCKTHDAECARIAANSRALYERLIAREGQLDYLQLVLCEIAARFRPQGGAAPPAATCTLAPGIAKCPSASGDWFGADSASYAAVGIGASAPAPPPPRPEWRTTECECPSCAAVVRQRRASAPAAVLAPLAAAAAARPPPAAGATRPSAAAGGAGGGGGGSGFAIKLDDKARARLAEARARAAASLAAGASAGEAPASGEAVGAKRRRTEEEE